MMHLISEKSAYAEGQIDAELASKGLVTEATNPYPQGSIDHAEYDRGVRDAQPRTRIVVHADGEITLVEV